jgi:superfamily I DNA/RNA helicase
MDDIRESKSQEHRRFSDFAVLVRGQRDSREMKHALQQSHIPCGPKQQGINVMTLHASKGLEFPVVYLPGVQENNLPHWNAINDGKTAIEEERRLFYVGVTRAGHRLTLSATRRRGPYSCQRSRFAAHLIDEALVEHHELAT